MSEWEIIKASKRISFSYFGLRASMGKGIGTGFDMALTRLKN